MPLYKEQGIVLRSVKLGEADKIVTILTQGSGKIRGVAKGIRRTNSKFGARLEPFTHVSLMLYQGRNLDTVTQAEIVSSFRALRSDFDLITAGDAMLEAVDRVAEEHERNVRLFLLLLSGLRALDGRPRDPAAVAESFLLKLLSLSGFHPSLSVCAGCGTPGPHPWFSAGQGGVVCGDCVEHDASRVSPEAVRWLDLLARMELEGAGDTTPATAIRKEARALLYGFTEYHLDRRIRSFTLLARQRAPQPEAVAP
ncbi:MAG TPA: DNA repair protein RecO [Actinomycetota bacterium]|nr:DNA repair protein RecO [Actinomycetota bacterium]